MLPRWQYVALYDYDPVKCSPNEHPEFELSFKEGALLKVYGGEMEDGFLAGEVGHVIVMCQSCDPHTSLVIVM